MSKPKVLFFDIETSPILAYVWGLFDQNIGLNQIYKDWDILSVAAKWGDTPEDSVMYKDRRNDKTDKAVIKWIWNLLDQADIVVTQNGKRFDAKKLNARFIMYGMIPPSGYKHIDTLQIAKKYFALTSNKLEFLTDKLCKKYKKQSHKKFSGFSLWSQCLAGNKDAWNEMEVYNKYDVLSLEELYGVLKGWDNSINFDLYNDEPVTTCKCGSKKVHKRGFAYTSIGKFQKYRCKTCGAETRSRKNLFSKEKKESLKVRVV